MYIAARNWAYGAVPVLGGPELPVRTEHGRRPKEDPKSKTSAKKPKEVPCPPG